MVRTELVDESTARQTVQMGSLNLEIRSTAGDEEVTAACMFQNLVRALFLECRMRLKQRKESHQKVKKKKYKKDNDLASIEKLSASSNYSTS
jgi:hypothetical protein